MSLPHFTRPAHILVVDDDATNRLVLRKLCELFGGAAETADGGEQALLLCATTAFDLVLMDVRMPRMNGAEAARAIRELPGPAGQIPIVAVTADTAPATRALCRRAGMDAFVEKPIGAQTLFEAMNAALLACEERLVAHIAPLDRPLSGTA